MSPLDYFVVLLDLGATFSTKGLCKGLSQKQKLGFTNLGLTWPLFLGVCPILAS